MNKINYKIIKEFRKSFIGNVFLIEYDNEKYILKKAPVSNKSTKNYQDELIKEMDVLNFISNLSVNNRKFFMTLKEFYFDKCNFSYQDWDSNKNAIVQKEIKNTNCINLILNYKGKTLLSLLEKRLSKSEKYSMVIQIIYAIDILKKNKYLHNDVHVENITYQKSSDKIKIGQKEFDFKYQFSLIDFGFSKHSKFGKEYLTKELLSINSDVINFIREVILQNRLLIDLDLKKKKPRNLEPKFKLEDLQEIFNNHKSIWNKIKNTLYKKGKEYIKWFEIFESGKIDIFFKNFNEEYPVLKLKGKNIINASIIEEIKILFSAYNRKLFLKLNGFKDYLPNLIPSKDIEFMILNLKDNKKIIDYFESNTV